MFLDSIMQRCNIYIMSKYLILLPILSLSFVIAQEEEEDINLDDLWDTTVWEEIEEINEVEGCLLYTSPSPRDRQKSRMPSSA